MRTCTVLATGRILEAQSGDKPDFEALIKNAEAAGYSADAVVCEVCPDAAVSAALKLQAALDAALAQLPAPSAVITRAEFKRRLAPAYLAMGLVSDDVQRKWDRILTGLLGDYETVHLSDPMLVELVGAAVGDGLLTQEQAAAVLATT